MMPDHIPPSDEDYPWDCDGQDDDLGNYEEDDNAD